MDKFHEEKIRLKRYELKRTIVILILRLVIKEKRDFQ